MRSRNIKPDFFTDEKLIKLSFAERLFFIGLWCYCDSEGFFEIKPHEMKLKMFPEQKVDIPAMLKSLQKQNVIKLHGQHGFLPNFVRHQRPHPKEKKSIVSKEIKDMFMKLNGEPCNYPASPSDIMNDVIMNVDIMKDERGMTEPGNASVPYPLDLSGLWNEKVFGKLPKVEAITKKRIAGINARLKETPKGKLPEIYWGGIIDRILESDFCLGNNDRGWKADFDFLLKPDTHVRVLEGKYDNRTKSKLNKTQEAILKSLGGSNGDGN